MLNIHASGVSCQQHGILIIGPSGSGKSDLTLRLIKNAGAILIADDRIDVENHKNTLIAHTPEAIAGLLEVRGIGIIKMPYETKKTVDLVVELVNNPNEIERLPEVEYYELGGVKIRKIKLWAFEASAVEKIILVFA